MIQYPPQAWAEYRQRRDEIEGLLDPRTHTADWLDVEIINGNSRVFASNDAVIVVTVRQYPAGATELHGLAAAGALEAILPLIEDAENWARGHGVTFATIASRAGWGPVLRGRGYSPFQIHLRKEL